MKDFYVYGYVRSQYSEHGPAGSYYYIGKGKGKRKYDSHRRVPRPVSPKLIVTIAKGLSEPDAFQLEMLLIYLYGRIDLGIGCLRNFTDGGQGSSNLSAETRAKLSASQKGKPHPWQVGKPSGKSGKPTSEETKRKLSAALKGRPSPNKGNRFTQTQEAREKIRAAKLDYWRKKQEAPMPVAA